MAKSKRFELLTKREVNKDLFIQEWPEVGLVNASRVRMIPARR